MKKFYTLLLAAATVASASAFTNMRSFDVANAKQVNAFEKMSLRSDVQTNVQVKKGSPLDNVRAASRAEADLPDVSKYNIQLFDDNFDDYDFYKSNEVTMEYVEDNLVQIHNLFGEELRGEEFEVYGEVVDRIIDGKNEKVLKILAGYKVLEFEDIDYVFFVAGRTADGYLDYDNVDFIFRDDKLESATDYFGVYVVDTKTDQGLGWWDLSTNYSCEFVASNATFNFEIAKLNDTELGYTEGTRTPASQPMYVGKNDDGSIFTNAFLTDQYFGYGYCVTWDANEGNFAAEMPLYCESLSTGQKDEQGNTIMTGDFYLFPYYLIGEEEGDDVTVNLTATYNNDELASLKVQNCYIFSLDGYWMASGIADGVITMDGVEVEGISSVAVDNSNAPVEYYNIQGVRVANPEAGQIYIVKQGSKVSKMIRK